MPAGDIAKGQVSELRVRVDGRVGLFLHGRGLLLASGFDARFVVRGEDVRAVQIFIGVDVFLFVLLLLARPLLARGFGYILRGAGAALGCAGKQTRAKNDRESAAKRRAERHPRVLVRLAETGEVSTRHCRPITGDIRWRNATGKPRLVLREFSRKKVLREGY